MALSTRNRKAKPLLSTVLEWRSKTGILTHRRFRATTQTLLMCDLRDTAQFLRDRKNYLRDRISILPYKRQVVNVIKTRINESRKFIQIVIGSFD